MCWLSRCPPMLTVQMLQGSGQRISHPHGALPKSLGRPLQCAHMVKVFTKSSAIFTETFYLFLLQLSCLLKQACAQLGLNGMFALGLHPYPYGCCICPSSCRNGFWEYPHHALCQASGIVTTGYRSYALWPQPQKCESREGGAS